MFDFIRSHTKILMFVLVLLIIPSFVFFGVQGYSGMGEGGTRTVATVAGTKITQGEWDFAHQRQVDRLRSQMPGLDARLLDSPQFKRETLDALVRERILLASVATMHIGVSDERLQRAFVTDPQFAFLRNPDNSVNRDVLAAQGMSSEQFAANLRQDIATRQVLDAVTGTVVAGTTPRTLALDALLEVRDVQVQSFAAGDYAAKVEPTDADLQAYYDNAANQVQFRLPEQAEIEYVTLDIAAISQGIAVPEEDLRRYYSENESRYTNAEERKASHILIQSDKDAPAAERAKAKAEAEDLLAQVRKAPEKFAELAKAHSDDPASAERGGELDPFGRGAFVKPFEDAAFSMKKGEIGNVVETDFGYHVIRLDDVIGGEKRPFDTVRAELEQQIRGDLAQSRFAESAEQFTNTVYEQSDSLQPVIERLKLTPLTATVQRSPAPGATGPLASQALLDAVFSDDALRNKRNTNAVEVGASQLAAARVVKHTPERLPPLAEIKDIVRDRVQRQMAAELARKDGLARLAELKANMEAGGLGAPVKLSRTDVQGLPPAVVEAVLRADAGSLPTVIGVDTGELGYTVARINKVEPPAPDSPELAQLRDRYAQAWAAAESQGYYEALKQRFDVELDMPALAATATSNP
jgi:peptidyl-prolyl cis-trans isomerase D